VLLVDDGTPPESARDVVALADDLPAPLLRLPANSGKGHAVAAGLRYLRAADPAPLAVVIVDADGQHPPAAIPALVEAAAGAELVVADRFGDLAAMPWLRRLPNRLASRILELTTGREVRDSQCGMRLLHGRALHEVPFPGGGFEAETRHLKACLRAGVRVAWVPIPALYPGGKSAFRPVRDSLRVAAALLA
jgi:glycosyltransferase involved in cell wall biosynthesis